MQKKRSAQPKSKKKKKISLADCIDLTGKASVARKTHDGMSATKKRDAEETIANTLQTKINKEVKNTLLDVAHREKLRALNCEYLSRNVIAAAKMVHPLKPTMEKLVGTHHAIKVGDYVEVLCEYAPGTCSDGGIGYIMNIEHDNDGLIYCTVSHVLDSRIETRIKAKKITVTPMPYIDLASTTRSKAAVPAATATELMPDRVYAAPVRSPLEWLKHGLSSRTHEKRGWLRDKLLHHNLLEPNDESLWKRILFDYKCQLSGIEGMRLAFGSIRTKTENVKNMSQSNPKVQLMCLRICGLSLTYSTHMTSNEATSRTKGMTTKREWQC